MGINFVEKQFAQVWWTLLVHDRNINIEWLAANAQTEEYHLNGGQ